MAGAFITVDIKGDKEFIAYLDRIAQRAGSAKPAFEIAGQVIATSIRKTFIAQGRPEKWTPLSPRTLASKNKRGSKILINRGMAGGLMGSIHSDPSDVNVRIGTDKVYGAIHQFGGKAGRGLKVNIPQREYLVIQDEDWTAIKAAFERYLTEE